MRSKNRGAKRLVDLLGEIDPAIIEEAYTIDNAEKLKKKKAEDVASRERKMMRFTVFYRVATAAVCFILVISISMAVMLWKRESDIPDVPPDPPITQPSLDNEKDPPGEEPDGIPDDPDNTDENVYIRIDSIDKMSYYLVKMTLLDKMSTHSVKSDGIALSANKLNDTVIYPINPNKKIVASKMIYFKIELINDQGFLATRLGMGTIEVMILKYNLFNGYIITFKNGENFYSCLSNGSSPTKMRFSTYTYIEGFNNIKNFDQTNFEFNFMHSDYYVTEMVCTYFKSTPTDSDPLPDEAIVLTETCIVSDVEYTFTLAELEEYVNSTPNGDGNVICAYLPTHKRKKGEWI